MLNWEGLDPKRTERGIQLLLRKKYPGLRSLDGAGGDGGRDAQLITVDDRTVFEIKSFGRLNSSRRRQVERSLRQAVTSAPGMTNWVLVIPMNMTPTRPGVRSSEEAWFDEDLPKLAPGVDLQWRGQDWLDDQVAGNMDVQRYIEGTDGQLLARAAVLNLEQAVLVGGTEDLHTRIGTLRSRVDEISPFWTLDFAVRDGVFSTMLRAKVEDAHLLDPIRITPTFKFRVADPVDDALRQQFERTMAFGGAVHLPAGYVTNFEIDASDEARLLFHTEDPAKSEFSVLTSRQQFDRPLRSAYQVLDADGHVLEHFHVYFREWTSGARGATLYGSDSSDIAKFEVGVPRPPEPPSGQYPVQLGDSHMDIKLAEAFAGYDVDALLPILRTLTAAVEGTTIRLELPELGHVSGQPLGAPPFAELAPLSQVVEDLRRMQEITGSLLRFPAAVTVGEVRELRNAVRQADGDTVEHEGGFILNLRPEAVGDFLATLKSAPQSGELGGFLAASELQELVLGEQTLLYGPVAFWAPHPRLANLVELQAFAAGPRSESQPASNEPEGVEARFEPTDAVFSWMPRADAAAYLYSDERPDSE